MDMVETAALLHHFYPEVKCCWLVSTGMMRELRVSPLVFWSNIKRELRPILTADPDTLRALGLPVQGQLQTVYDVAQALVDVLAPEVEDSNRDIAEAMIKVLIGDDHE